MAQIPTVSSYANGVIKTFTSHYTNSDNEVEMVGEYLPEKANACKDLKKFSSVEEIENELGIKILKSPIAYAEKKYTITYNPYVSKKGELYGAMLIDSFYIIGDLKDVSVTTFKDWSTGNNISYTSGDKFSSPISSQITIRTDKNEDVNYQNHELEYGGANWDLSGSKDVEVYKSSNLGINIVLHTADTDGPCSWNNIENQITHVSYANFFYKGIEYCYCGDVSYDTLKEIIEGLEL